MPEVGIYKKKISREKVRKHALDQELRFKEKRKKTQSWPIKKEIKQDIDQEKKSKFYFLIL